MWIAGSNPDPPCCLFLFSPQPHRSNKTTIYSFSASVQIRLHFRLLRPMLMLSLRDRRGTEQTHTHTHKQAAFKLGSVTRSEKCGEWGDLDKIRFEPRVPLTSTCSHSLSLSKRNRLACLRFFFSPCALACDLALPFSLSPFCFFSLCHAKKNSLNFVSRSVEFGFLDSTLLSGNFQAL